MKHDPELVEIVEAIASDPRAGLFVTRPLNMLDRLADERGIIRPTGTRLTSAESELLSVHRELVVELLLEQARAGLVARKSIARIYVDPKHRSLEVEPDALVEIRRSSTHLASLLAIVRGDNGPVRSTPSELCAMACRLVDSAYARVLLGLDRSAAGNYVQARRTFLTLLGQPLSERMHRSCLENLGMVHFLMGEYGLAMEYYEAAARRYEDSLNAAVSGLVVAGVFRSSKQEYFADRLDDLGPVDTEFVQGLVEECLADLRAQRGKLQAGFIKTRGATSAYVIHEIENA